MKTKKSIVRKVVLAVLSCVIISGSILFSSTISKAAHEKTCDKKLYYRGPDVITSSYTHNSQYGMCYVSVREVFDKYACNCNDSISLTRTNRQETHSQPHG